MRKFKSEILITAIFAIIIAAIPAQSLEATRKALSLCETTVIPALFPFFVCSGMLVQLGAAEILGEYLSGAMIPLFGVGGGGALAVVMGLVSGYPVGAKTAAELVKNKKCSKSEGEKLLAFCNNSGPHFILGSVGSGMLKNPQAGMILYTAHFMASLTVAVIFRAVRCEITKIPQTADVKRKKSFGEMLTDSIKNAADSVFTISGFVIIFNIILSSAEYFGIFEKLSAIGIKSEIWRMILYALTEPTNGCIAVVETIKNPVAVCMILSAVVGWSGISVHLQVLGIIKNAGLSAKYYFVGKIMMTLLAPVYTLLMIKLYPVHISAFAGEYSLPGIYFGSGAYFVAAVVVTAVFTGVAFVITAVHRKFIKIK